jgi:hypothetical protein
MLHREVDYEHERHFTETFAQKIAGDERLAGRFVVPQVVGEYCADRVLTTTYEHGCSVRDAQVRALPLARRSALGRSFLELFLVEFFNWGLVQSDPHFGNYRFRVSDQGDQVVLLDFGATRVFGRGFIENYARIVRGALARNRPDVWRGARAIGLMDAGFPKGVLDAFAQMCELIVEPFADPDSGAVPPQLKNARGEYRWGESDLPMRASKVAAVNALSVHFRVPPREIVFLHRRLAGVFIMLATLGAELDGREPLNRALAALAGGDEE